MNTTQTTNYYNYKIIITIIIITIERIYIR